MASEDIFKQVIDAGWAGLESWRADKQPETFQLEFKGRGHDAPQLALFDRAALGKAVSGFANVSGGVLILGIKTTRIKGVDCVAKLEPARSLRAYVEAVNKHLLICTDPRVPGAHAKGIDDGTGSDRGVVALVVPASDGGPHRAKVAGDDTNDKYFARQGTQTLVLEHSLLADRFARSAPPQLEIVFQPHGQTTFVAGVEVRLRNNGRGCARQPAVLFEEIPTDTLEIKAYSPRTPQCFIFEPTDEVSGGPRYLLKPHGTPEIILYPTLDMHAANLPFKANARPPGNGKLRFRGVIFALNAQPVPFDFAFESGQSGESDHGRSMAKL